jgi:chromosome segregation ATPase
MAETKTNPVQDVLEETLAALVKFKPAAQKLDDVEKAIEEAKARLNDVLAKIEWCDAALARHPIHKADEKVDKLIAEAGEWQKRIEAKRAELIGVENELRWARDAHAAILAEREEIRKRLGFVPAMAGG